jgi:hypothetical protein
MNFSAGGTITGASNWSPLGETPRAFAASESTRDQFSGLRFIGATPWTNDPIKGYIAAVWRNVRRFMSVML